MGRYLKVLSDGGIDLYEYQFDMDFKNRFAQNRATQGNRNNNLGAGSKGSINANPLAHAFSTSNRQPNIKNNGLLSQERTGGGLNRFKKAPTKGTAPKEQFKKYMIEANNVFYEDRSQLRELQKLKLFKWGLFFFWFLLAASYFLIGRITPYEGVCPPMATCGVFVHCPDLFEYDHQRNECKLSEDFLEEISKFSISHIEKLQLEYGQKECKGEQSVPKLMLNELFDGLQVQNNLKKYQSAAIQFFRNKKNQQNYGFQLVSNAIIPTKKSYSFGCKLKLILTDSSSLFNLSCILLAAIVVLFVAYRVLVTQRYTKMYNFLKERVFTAEDKTLNITHTLSDLQDAFGPINQQIWGKINDLRAADKKIGFYEDDFLYWKAA